MKSCSRCKEEKPLANFYPDSSKSSGYSSQCKDCRAESGSNYRSDPANAEAARKRARDWYADNKDRAKQYAADNPTDPLERALKRYGITRAEYDLLVLAQDNRCAICEATSANRAGGRLVIDHCHDTENVRGLLCHSCNRGLGMFRDSALLVNKALRYLKETQGEPV